MGFRNAGGMALSYIFMSIIRFVQFALALAVCGLYGVDLQAARNAGKYVDGRWAFAVVVGSLSAVTAALYMIPFVMQIHLLFVWDALLFFFWVVVFGIFGNMYIKENAEGDAGVQRMKNAVWVDLANMLLWLITAVIMICIFFKHRGGDRSRFTGRARTGV